MTLQMIPMFNQCSKRIKLFLYDCMYTNSLCQDLAAYPTPVTPNAITMEMLLWSQMEANRAMPPTSCGIRFRDVPKPLYQSKEVSPHNASGLHL